MTGQLKSPLTENPPPNTIQLLLPLPASNTFGTPLFMHAVEFSISSVILIPCQLRILKWKSVKLIQTVQVHTRTWIDGAAKWGWCCMFYCTTPTTNQAFRFWYTTTNKDSFLFKDPRSSKVSACSLLDSPDLFTKYYYYYWRWSPGEEASEQTTLLSCKGDFVTFCTELTQLRNKICQFGTHVYIHYLSGYLCI